MLDPREAVRILDACDRVLAAPSQRGHRFAWLLESGEPGAEPARVDAWYPERRMVVDVRGLHADEELHRRAPIVRAYDLEYAVAESPDEVWLREALTTEEGHERQRVQWGGPPVVFGANVGDGWTAYAPLEGVDDEDWDDDEPDEDDDGEDDDEPVEGWSRWEPDVSTQLGEIGLLDSSAAEVLGWRGRSIALALLGAVWLTRRALTTDDLQRDDDVEVLLALAAAEVRPATERGLSREELVSALAVDAGVVDMALERLSPSGHVHRGGIPEEGPEDELWSLTPRGLAVVARLLQRANPLFRDWPPD